MICFLCKGAGSFFEQTKDTRQWWTCQDCGGDGVKNLYGPPIIKSHAKDRVRALASGADEKGGEK